MVNRDPSPSATTENTVSQTAPPESLTSRTRLGGEYSVTSSSVVASRPRMSRVSENLVPTPRCCSVRNRTSTMWGMASQNFSMWAMTSKTASGDAAILRVALVAVAIGFLLVGRRLSLAQPALPGRSGRARSGPKLPRSGRYI
jgi:hypothetical protein